MKQEIRTFQESQALVGSDLAKVLGKIAADPQRRGVPSGSQDLGGDCAGKIIVLYTKSMQPASADYEGS